MSHSYSEAIPFIKCSRASQLTASVNVGANLQDRVRIHDELAPCPRIVKGVTQYKQRYAILLEISLRQKSMRRSPTVITRNILPHDFGDN